MFGDQFEQYRTEAINRLGRKKNPMAERAFGFTYDGQSVFSYIEQGAPSADNSSTNSDFFVYVMGPYTAFDATYAFDDAEKLQSPFVEDPLFDPDEHIVDEMGDFEKSLSDVCDDISERLGVRAFIATDIDIPTTREVETQNLDEPGMPVLNQSVAFAAVSDAVVFVYSLAGLNIGISAEVGAILGEFHLRIDDQLQRLKPRERLRIFRGPGIESASVGEIPDGYGVDCIDFDTREDLLRKIQQFLVNVRRAARDENLPVFIPRHGE